MRFYVAGASAEIERSEKVIAELRARGHEITLDWPAAMRAEPKKDHELSDDEARGYADADLRGVYTAEVFILVAPPRNVTSAGCWCELNTARERYLFGMTPNAVFAVGLHARASIFTRATGVRCITCADDDIVDDVLAALGGKL